MSRRTAALLFLCSLRLFSLPLGASANETSDAQREYDQKYVGFLGITGINQYGAVVAHWTQPYQGKYQRALGPAEFFEAVDKPELATEYRQKTRIKRALGIPGSILLTGGLVTAITAGTIAAVNAACVPNDYRICGGDDSNVAVLGAGIGAFTVGLGLVIAAAIVHRPSLLPEEARAMADQHNRELRQRLGLPADEERASVEKHDGPHFALAPRIGAHGGGLDLRLTF